ncbi:MAG: beta-ketoacyl-ACP synthase II [Bacteroidales bacterium]|nr:beta-ketoacyl-ACP synthase II [Bacteroidales bacterium]MDD7608146.1 beta-ketoacyl-ACP synthase II [Bacteroidales bacterium]MDY5459009.1 beta-ketoacyl-ACP synthase II [Candidatus Cryptobacteroides sp.]MEE0340037.1 beta-ketoacyl-ACP synthase II [Bacteroidales bacterium]
MSKRVVITGLGVLSCLGHDVDTFWKNLVNGECGIDYIEGFPTDGFEVKIGGEVRDFVPENFGMDKPFIRKQDKFTVYAVASAYQAMKDSGLVSGENIDPFRLGVYIGSGIGGFETIQREVSKILEDPTGRWISPNFVPCIIGNMAAGQVAIKFQANGPCIDVVTACATSTHAIGEAYRAIKHGYADAILSGGTDKAVIPIGVAAFANAKTLSKIEDPKKASLPFNANRDGFVMAEGSAVLMLEEYEHAKARGAKIYAEVVGYGSTCDAYHATAPNKEGTTQARCISDALSEAGFDPKKDNLYVNAHGTATHLNDLSETKACKLALGDFAYKAHISSTKSMHGHMLGATGAAEAIASVLALRDGIVPPTINLDTPDPELDLDYTPNEAVKSDLTLAISNSFGFGGHNGCLAFRLVED